jgi:hypothetical protein
LPLWHTTIFSVCAWTLQLVVDGKTFAVFINPYSLACNVRAPMALVSTIAELESIDAREKILVLRGELAKEQWRWQLENC